MLTFLTKVTAAVVECCGKTIFFFSEGLLDLSLLVSELFSESLDKRGFAKESGNDSGLTRLYCFTGMHWYASCCGVPHLSAT